ncbi:hypothetical protein GC089_02015 [Cellulomonas sp. JZ18]|uniref:hypothetical protein n=1 Tax=Cellulomonas sp. JZ18 TaxID=2654191 RepID=UPI0012D3E606|nr:hypothetical protein [Cellulomonas sp. JZ18]QGQ18264.1 hypothetical protein GC089_02015 [Cellulomonas sp. JZ18]
MSTFAGPAGPPAPAPGAPATVVDWRPPPGPPGWLVGAGTTRGERALVAAATVVGTALVVAAGSGAWRWWQWALVVTVAIDVVGGVAANALSTAKRQYHGPATGHPGRTARALRHPVAFAAAHVHPFVLVLALPGDGWAWAGTWYAACVAGSAAVHVAPLHLARPLAFAVLGTLLVAAPLVPAPAGLAWFGPLLACKLVAAHAVREEPYRPAGTSAAAPGAGQRRGPR